MTMDDHILKTWNLQASKYGQSHEVSWGDLDMISLEVEQISSRIEPGKSILDIGCANGYSTKMIIKRVAPSAVYAADFSPGMVEEAKKLLSSLSLPNLRIFQSDIRNIDLPSDSVDVCYAIRTLINLPTWADQLQAIDECLRVTKSGGRVLFSEGFWEPLMRLNALRQVLGLRTLVEHDFNRYLKQDRLEAWLKTRNYHYEIIEFSSLYYLGTRLARELATDHDSFTGFSNPINSEFARLAREYPCCGNIGVQKLVAIRKP